MYSRAVTERAHRLRQQYSDRRGRGRQLRRGRPHGSPLLRQRDPPRPAQAPRDAEGGVGEARGVRLPLPRHPRARRAHPAAEMGAFGREALHRPLGQAVEVRDRRAAQGACGAQGDELRGVRVRVLAQVPRSRHGAGIVGQVRQRHGRVQVSRAPQVGAGRGAWRRDGLWGGGGRVCRRRTEAHYCGGNSRAHSALSLTRVGRVRTHRGNTQQRGEGPLVHRCRRFSVVSG
mmetsp:Transcript_60375/g.160818  ORF Transcript_60375/g.160818 Transcript_60375/m.160818 type:complete len:231 (+) Transcript_60375:1326-2018(+)